MENVYSVSLVPTKSHWDDHKQSFLIESPFGWNFCMQCFAENLMEEKLITYVSYAAKQFLLFLEFEAFRFSVLERFEFFLIRPLVECIGCCQDEELGNSLVEICITLCKSSSTNSEVLNDFLRHLVMDLESQLSSSFNELSLHLLGLLIETHCSKSHLLPKAVKNKDNFFAKLVNGLTDSRDGIKGECLFVLWRLSTLEGGFSEIQKFFPRVIRLAMHASLLAEHDALKVNAIALLTSLNENGNLDLDYMLSEEKCDSVPNTLPSSRSDSSSSLITSFLNVIKRSILSVNCEIQLAVLELIIKICKNVHSPCDIGIQIIVDSGISEFVFEVLRGIKSGEKDSIVLNCVKVLNIFSIAGEVFGKHFIFGYEIILKVLEMALEKNFEQLLIEIIILFDKTFQHHPINMPTASIENMLHVFSTILKAKESLWKDDKVILFTSTCMTITSIIKWKEVSISSSSIELILIQTCSSLPNLKDAVISMTCLNASLLLLSQILVFFDKKHANEESKLGQDYQSLNVTAIEMMDLYLLPCFLSHYEHAHEEIFLHMFHSLACILSTCDSKSATEFAKKLAKASALEWCYDTMEKFPKIEIKQMVYAFVVELVNALIGQISTEIKTAFLSIEMPISPVNMLHMLQQKFEKHDLNVYVQQAIVKVLYVCLLNGNRIAENADIFSSIEIFLSQLSYKPSQTFLLQLLTIFIFTKYPYFSNSFSTSCTIHSQSILIEFLKTSDFKLSLIHTPFLVLSWIFNQPSLSPFLFDAMKGWMCIGMNQEIKSLIRSNEFKSQMNILASLINENNHACEIFLEILNDLWTHLVQNNAAFDFTFILKNILHKLEYGGRNTVFVKWIEMFRKSFILYGTKLSNEKIFGCFSLLIKLLLSSKTDVLDSSQLAIYQITMQCNLVLNDRIKKFPNVEKKSFLCMLTFMNVIMYKSITMQNDYLSESIACILSNNQLNSFLIKIIMDASVKKTKLKRISVDGLEGKLIHFSLQWCLFVIRIKAKLGTPFLAEEDFFILPTNSKHEEKERREELNKQKSILPLKCLFSFLLNGSLSLSLLSCACILESFSPLQMEKGIVKKEEIQQNLKNISIPFLKFILMVLQNSSMHPHKTIQTLSSSCLSLLSSSPLMPPLHRLILCHSPWNKILMEDFLQHELLLYLQSETMTMSLDSHLNDDGEWGKIRLINSILSCNPRPFWVEGVLNPSVLERLLDSAMDFHALPPLSFFFLFRSLLLHTRFLDLKLKTKLNKLMTVCKQRKILNDQKPDVFSQNFESFQNLAENSCQGKVFSENGLDFGKYNCRDEEGEEEKCEEEKEDFLFLTIDLPPISSTPFNYRNEWNDVNSMECNKKDLNDMVGKRHEEENVLNFLFKWISDHCTME